LKPIDAVDACMQCHYCDDEAAVAVEKNHLKVGLCEKHLRERMEELSDSEVLADFESQIDDALDR
jgi:cytochrome c553